MYAKHQFIWASLTTVVKSLVLNSGCVGDFMRVFSCLAAAVLTVAGVAAGHAQSIAYRLSGAMMTANGLKGDPGLRPNEQMVATFDGDDRLSVDAAHSSNYGFYTGRHVGTALAPCGDDSQFAAVGAHGSMAFDLRQFSTAASHLASVSVHVGSLDSYNFVEILGLTESGDVDYSHPLLTVDGTELMAAGGRDGRLTFGFDDNLRVGGILFGSTGIAFEFDSLAVSTDPIQAANLTAPVPEPTSWALMVGGFGLAGGALRSRHQRTRRTPGSVTA